MYSKMIKMYSDTSKGSLILLLITSFYSTQQFYIDILTRFPETRITKNGSSVRIFDTGKNASCIPLSQRPTFSWLLHNKTKNGVVQIEPNKIKDLLRRMRCAVEEAHSDADITLDTRTACPNSVDEEEDYEEYYEYIGNETEYGDIIDIREDYDEDCDIEGNVGGGFANTKLAKQHFVCSLEITGRSLTTGTSLPYQGGAKLVWCIFMKFWGGDPRLY